LRDRNPPIHFASDGVVDSIHLTPIEHRFKDVPPCSSRKTFQAVDRLLFLDDSLEGYPILPTPASEIRIM